jgi:hypothetical protein
MNKKYNRVCPNCNNVIYYKHKKSLSRADRMKSVCMKCRPKFGNRTVFGTINGMWKGIEDMPYRYISDIQNHAKANGRECSISLENLYEQYKKQDGKCIYSNESLSFVRRGRKYRTGNASVDRIDSSKGYTKDNIQWVDKNINRMKSNFSSDQFVNMCSLVSNNSNNIKTPVDIFIQNNK